MAVQARSAIHPPASPRRALKLFHRNLLAYKHFWLAFVSGFFEPLFYLVAVGFGVGQFVGSVPYGRADLEYAVFLAPGLLAASTLNGAVFDGFFSPFFKLNWMKTYEGIVTTPVGIPDIAVGEIVWALMRGTVYGAGFLIVMLTLGLIDSPWALLALPAVMLSAGALSAGAMVLTGATKEISSLEKVMTLIVFPLFLFSGTFFPVTLYPDYLQPVVMATPLFHSASLLRDLTTGQVTAGTLVHAAYLAAMFVVAAAFAVRLMRRRLVS
jgi:lipooligosaccharide transport system permease protein